MTRLALVRLGGLALVSLRLLAASSPVSAAPAEQVCEPYVITAYAASDYPGWTADGSTTTVAALNRGENIAAASYNVPFGAYVQVLGVGVYRVADRGHLGPRHIDVLMRTRGEAIEFGRQIRTVCSYV